jgi:DNA-binding NarL/FixJ family response regulator
MSEPVRILLVEDQSIARLALHTIIDPRPDMRIVAETGRGDEAPALYDQHRPDVVIMDLRLPGLSGFDAIARIRLRHPSARILALTNYEGSEDVHRALHSGALAYLTKDTAKEELIQAILAVARGKRYLPPSVSALLAERTPGSDLTDRELDVLRLLAQGCSNRALAESLGISENTARIHVTHILQKLGVEDRTQAVLTAIRRGIVHVDS